MNNTATLTENLPSEPAKSQQPEKKPVFTATVVIAGLILALTLAGSVWLYLEGTQGLQQLTKTHAAGAAASGAQQEAALVIKGMNSWLQQVVVALGAGSAGLLVTLALGGMWWRSRWLQRMTRRTQAWVEGEQRLQETSAELSQLALEHKQLKEDYLKATDELERRVEERTATLAGNCAQLQKDLDDRRMAERMLAQQTKELERSKDVLELHVQARTVELQKLQRRTESILNSAGEGIYGLDLQGKTTFVNPAAAKITGWKVEELIGKLEHEAFHRQSPNGAAPSKETHGEHLGDHMFTRKDGSSFPVEYMRTPIHEKDRLVGAVVIFKDITDRKRAEETLNRKAAELARSNSELEQFAYVASHDLQEPLRKIQAFGDRLKAKCDAVNLQDGRDYLERMQGAAARMQTLINDLLTFSRVISASQPFAPVDLNEVTKGVLSDLEVRIEQTKARIEIGELPTIDADALQMRQLLQNLIGNALKFQPAEAHPVVKIQAQLVKEPLVAEGETPRETCELTIQDNGIGFDEQYLEKIFAVFQRLHGRNEYEGTGVGLAVCRRITDRHGGIITARSKLGEGATFVVHLPVKHTRKEIAP